MVPDPRRRSLNTLPDVTKATVKQPVSYAVGLALAASLAACGGSPSVDATSETSSRAATQAPTQASTQAPTQAPTQATTAAPTQKSPKRMVITITARKVVPAPSTVSIGVGESLMLVVTSDHDNTLHAHGFDVEQDLVAGRQTTVTLTGKTAGSYEVETHDPELRLLVVDVH